MNRVFKNLLLLVSVLSLGGCFTLPTPIDTPCEKYDGGYICFNGNSYTNTYGPFKDIEREIYDHNRYFLCKDPTYRFDDAEAKECKDKMMASFLKHADTFCKQGNNLQNNYYFIGSEKGNTLFVFSTTSQYSNENYFVDANHKPIPPTETITFCTAQSIEQFNDMIRKVREEEQEKAIAQEYEKKQKKFGKKFCIDTNVDQYLARAETIPTNCITEIKTALRVVQQVEGGTLATSPYLPAAYSDSNIVFIVNNKEIANIPDGGLFAGYFIGAGTYKYTNIFGATRTIQKVKLLERR